MNVKSNFPGMGGMMKGGMQQRSEMGMDHMGMRNQIGVRGDREMGMDNRMRPPSQSGSDQYRMGDRDNRRSSAGKIIKCTFCWNLS